MFQSRSPHPARRSEITRLIKYYKEMLNENLTIEEGELVEGKEPIDKHKVFWAD